MTVHRTRVVEKIMQVAGEEVVLYGETDVFVVDAMARPPCWLLVRSLWHFFPASGISLCGYVPTSIGMFGAATPGQLYDNHTKRKRRERTVTTFCRKCEKASLT